MSTTINTEAQDHNLQSRHDLLNVGSLAYKGRAHFWHECYKWTGPNTPCAAWLEMVAGKDGQTLRNASRARRRAIHHALLAAGLDVSGASPQHEAIIQEGLGADRPKQWLHQFRAHERGRKKMQAEAAGPCERRHPRWSPQHEAKRQAARRAQEAQEAQEAKEALASALGQVIAQLCIDRAEMDKQLEKPAHLWTSDVVDRYNALRRSTAKLRITEEVITGLLFRWSL